MLIPKMVPTWLQMGVKMKPKIINIDKNKFLKQGLKKITNKCEN